MSRLVAVVVILAMLLAACWGLCPQVSRTDVKKLCKNPECTTTLGMAKFCQNLYAKKLKCLGTYLPLKYLCDGIAQCKLGLDEEPQVCSHIQKSPPSITCGSISIDSQMEPLILNGSAISPVSWPWYAALYSNVEPAEEGARWTFFCGATIVSPDTLVTAAHCVWRISETRVRAVAGKRLSDFNATETGEQAQIATIKDVFVHPLYQDALGNYGSDIAVVKLERALRFDDSVAGMGVTETGAVAESLRATSVRILPAEQCIQSQRAEFKKYVTLTTFCARGQEGLVCNGDSGSGLAIKNKQNGKWVLEGIVSISPKNPNDPVCHETVTIYTKVGTYVDWIYQHLIG